MSLKVSSLQIEITFSEKKVTNRPFFHFSLAGMINAIKQTVLVQVYKYNYPFQTISIDLSEGLSAASTHLFLC